MNTQNPTPDATPATGLASWLPLPGRLADVALAAFAATILVTGCSTGDDSSEPEASPSKHSSSSSATPSCADAVGKPLADQYPTAEDNGPACAPGAGVVEAGCYPGGEYDEAHPFVYWSADDGSYFAKTGGTIQFVEGTPSIDAMSAKVGCE